MLSAMATRSQVISVVAAAAIFIALIAVVVLGVNPQNLGGKSVQTSTPPLTTQSALTSSFTSTSQLTSTTTSPTIVTSSTTNTSSSALTSSQSSNITSTMATNSSSETRTTASSLSNTSTSETTTTSGTKTTTSTTTTNESKPTLEIDAIDGAGTPVTGLYVVLEQTSNNSITTGYTPAIFNVTMGQNYTITATDGGHDYFNHWTNNFTVRVMPITITSSNSKFTVVYESAVEPPPTTTPYSITVTSHDLNGTAVGGFFIDVRVNGYHITSGDTPVTFSNLEPGIRFQVIFYWYNNYWLRELSDGDLNRYASVMFNTTGATSVSYDGLYQYVPSSQAARLNIQAEFPNGTIIGTTFNNTSYIEHTPGVWLTVAPPNSSTPFTGTFTGGSILPFVLFNHETYTVAMTPGYAGCLTFTKWQDTGSTKNVRAVTMNGDETLVAIYTQVGACPNSVANEGAPALPMQVNTTERTDG